MRVIFPSQNGLTWQGQRSNTSPMDSTTNLTAMVFNDPSGRERVRGTSTNRPQGAHLYFIKMGGTRRPVKIGRANNPQERLVTLQVASPYRLTLLGSLEDCGHAELRWHRFLARDRMLGEWFAWSKRVEEAVKLAVDGGDWETLMAEPEPEPIGPDDWRIGSPLYQGDPKYPQFQYPPMFAAVL